MIELNHHWHGIDMLVVLYCALLAANACLLIGLLSRFIRSRRLSIVSLIGMFFFSTAAWATSTALTNLSSAAAISGTDVFYVVQTMGTGGFKATMTQVSTFINSVFSGDATVSAGGTVTVTKLNGASPGTGVATAFATNLSAAGGFASTIAKGTAALGTAAINSTACTLVTVAATNVVTTDVVEASFNGDPTAVTGYIPATAGTLSIYSYPTASNINFKICNNTNSSITPGAITLNWRVTR